jgi:NitT/TauT family transport system substrate-binding protein
MLLTRGAFTGGLVAAAIPKGKPEHPAVRVGLAVEAMSFLPAYVANARTYKEAGLDVSLVAFRGDAEVAQALAGDSIDVSYASLNGLLNLINSGQPILGFYSGFHQADFTFNSVPSVKRWSDLKGKAMGISTYGSLTDALVRYALHRNHLEPERDVQIMQIGGTPASFAALQAGRIAAAILSPPFQWQAEDAGLNVLGTQAHDVAPDWPKHVISAKTAFINQNPNTITAFLRAHVNAIRLARSDRDFAVGVMMDRLKLTRVNAERAWRFEMPWFDERGTLPAKSMPVFWDISKSLGDVKEPLPEAKFLDKRWMDSFREWAP